MAKKAKFFVVAVLCLFAIGLAVSDNSFADNYIRAYAKDAFINGSPADHTYTCVWGNCYAIGGSSTSGGWYATRGYASNENINNAICADGCVLYYAQNGVCHQHSNRMLYYAGTTIPSYIRYYSISKALYGVYGDYGPANGRFDVCRYTCE